ncbi:MAG: sulfite exporter TauE/SafE family protein [Clostridia bacterium]|nr:sulfite exporter TauE/SafE family protein [Clostridia bacterium]
MSVITTILFLLVVFAAFTLQSMTGFGGPLVAMPICILLASIDDAKAVLGVLAWITAVVVMLQTWRDVNRKELLRIAAGMFIGMFVGVRVYDAAPKSTLLVIFGVVVLCVALKNLLVKKEWNIPTWLRYIMLLLAGLMQGLFLSGGSFLIMYAQQTFKDKNEFRATSSAVWAVTNTYMVATQAASGMYSAANFPLLCMSLAVALVSVWVGGRLQARLPRETFIKITNFLLLAAGVILLFNSRG